MTNLWKYKHAASFLLRYCDNCARLIPCDTCPFKKAIDKMQESEE